MRPAVTIASSGGLFFSLKDLINETYKCNNEDTYLDQIRICNIHWQALLSFVWRVSPSEKWEGRPPLCALTFRVDSIAQRQRQYNKIIM